MAVKKSYITASKFEEESEYEPVEFEDWEGDAFEKSPLVNPLTQQDQANLTKDWLSAFAREIDPKTQEENATWKPQIGPQSEAFNSKANELFYGGAAGGGKTDLMIGLATSERSPHRRSIIFRRTYPELKDIVRRTEELNSGTGAHFKGGTSMRFEGLPAGKSLELGAVNDFQAAQKYKGRAHDLKLFDEVSDIDESVYTFLIGWARTADEGVPVRVVAAGNPPTNANGNWVIRRWAPWLDPTHINPARPGELRWFATLDGEDKELTPEVSEAGSRGETFEFTTKAGKVERIRPKSRTFIPARLSDNKFLADTDYEAVLQGMPEPYRSQLLYGDFALSLKPDPWQIIPTEWAMKSQRRWEEAEKDGTLALHARATQAFGLDVAEAGSDYTAFTKLTTPYVQFIEYIKEEDTMKQADLISLKMIHSKRSPIAVDAIGVGLGVAHRLRQLGFVIAPVKVSRASTAKDKTGQFEFLNLRSELWWRLREALDINNPNQLIIPPDRRLLQELTTPRFELTPNGKIKVQSKDEIRSVMGRSPDGAESLMLALYAARLTASPLRMF